MFRSFGLCDKKSHRERYLGFEVPVHDPDVVHVADGRHQLPHDAAGLRFAEMLLPADPFQQLPSAQQLQQQVRVELQQTQQIILCCQIIQVQNTK